jgi:phospholipid-translocating ATPase
MVFRGCSIAGKIYTGDPENDEREEEKDEIRPLQPIHGLQEFTRSPSGESSTAVGSKSGGTPDKEAEGARPSSGGNDPLASGGIKLSHGVLEHFHDATLKHDIESSVHADPNSENATLARSLNGFFIVLALCHTVLTAVDSETGAIEYKAQSPDEAALVQAAADMGYIFRGREAEVLLLQTPFSDEVERYELLNLLEFTSARKRMSVAVRKLDGGDGRIFLLTKGADNVIFERLRPGADELKEVTERHLAEFASQGLRTLTLAYKVIQGEIESLEICKEVERSNAVFCRGRVCSLE